MELTVHKLAPLQILWVPAGLVACLTKRSDASIFLVLYGVTALYFSGVMVRWGSSTQACIGVACSPGPACAQGASALQLRPAFRTEVALKRVSVRLTVVPASDPAPTHCLPPMRTALSSLRVVGRLHFQVLGVAGVGAIHGRSTFP